MTFSEYAAALERSAQPFLRQLRQIEGLEGQSLNRTVAAKLRPGVKQTAGRDRNQLQRRIPGNYGNRAVRIVGNINPVGGRVDCDCWGLSPTATGTVLLLAPSMTVTVPALAHVRSLPQ